MEKIKITIIEDEFVIAEDIADLLHINSYQVVDKFDRAESALDSILQSRPDLLLVDIQLAGSMNGIDLVREVKTKMNLPVIYITANSEKVTYEKAKATRPNAFLVKPFTPANLLAAIDLALVNYSNEQVPAQIERPLAQNLSYETFIHNCLFIRANGGHQKICADSILFVEASGSYVHVQTDKERFTLSQNLITFFNKYPTDNLARVHRSFLVNISRIDSFKESWIFIGNHKLPISDSYRESFLKRIHCI